MTQDDPRHGTLAGYVAGCRLDCCRHAASRYEARRTYDLDHGRPRMVDATGTRRRVQALAAVGWPVRALSDRVGGLQLQRALYGRSGRSSRVYARTADQVRRLYLDLADKTGPSSSARKRAQAKGWPPPIAWDDDTIDDPAMAPWAGMPVDCDPVVVERILAGEWSLKANRAERLEVARRHVAAGGSLYDLERRGWNPHRDLRTEAA